MTELDKEAHALVELFNEAKPDHSPELEWFAMRTDHETGQVFFALEADEYIDSDGLEALREHGREVSYIEAFQHHNGGGVSVSIEIPVRGEIPTGTAEETEP
jgi:hypothetical protein